MSRTCRRSSSRPSARHPNRPLKPGPSGVELPRPSWASTAPSTPPPPVARETVQAPQPEPEPRAGGHPGVDVDPVHETTPDAEPPTPSASVEKTAETWEPVVRELAEEPTNEQIVEEPETVEVAPRDEPDAEVETVEEPSMSPQEPDHAEEALEQESAEATGAVEVSVEELVETPGGEEPPSTSVEASPEAPEAFPAQVEGLGGSDDAPRRKFRLFRRGGEDS